MEIKDLSLWGLSEALTKVIEDGFYVDDETGEVFFTGDELESLEERLDEKLNGLVGYIKFTDSMAEISKARKAEFESNMKYYEKRAEKLKDYLKLIMDKNEMKKKELPNGRLSTRKSSSVEIEDEQKIIDFLDKNPELKDSCFKTEIKSSFIKKGLKEVLTDKEVPGAKIIEKESLIIK